MGFELREGIWYCRIGERAIFLDVIADRYFCLASKTERSFLEWLSKGCSALAIDEHISGLIRRGLLVETPAAAGPQACEAPPPCASSLLDRTLAPAGFRRVGGALSRLCLAALALKTIGLARSLRRIASAKAQLRVCKDAGEQHLEDIAARYVEAAHLISLLDNCLVHSLAVASHMIARGLRPDLVIGVQLGPFSAHCWVQHRGVLVNDRFDMVRTFTPILAI